MDNFDFHRIQNRFPRVWCGGHVYLRCGEGWLPLLWELSESIDNAMVGEELACTKILRVQEESGGLRLSIEILEATKSLREKITALVEEAQEKSRSICEHCGSTEGVTTQGRLLRTLCENCRQDERVQ